MWKCRCGALVSDKTDECPLCRCGGSSSSVVIIPNYGEGTETPPVEDQGGMIQEDRMKPRPFKEVADSHLLLAQRARERTRRRKPKLFDEAVVPGSVRTSRPIFSTIKR